MPSPALILAFIAFLSLLVSIRADLHDLHHDFDDPEVIRVERAGDYAVGGPLAKGTQAPKGGNSGSGSDTGSAPAPAPASSAPAPAPASSEPAPAPAPASGAPDSGSGTSKPAPQPPSISPPPGKGGKGNCGITVIPASVLPEIASNMVKLPDYNLKYSDDCKGIGECARLCDKAACNYFIRRTDSDLAHFFKVTDEKIKSASYVDSTVFDSFVPQCPMEAKLPDVNPGSGATQAPGGAGETQAPGGGPAGTGQPVGPPDGSTGSPGGVTGGTPGGGAEGTTVAPRTRKPFEPIDRCPECTLKDLFKRFLLANNRSYNPYEEERRFKIFQDNVMRIGELVKNRDPSSPPDANYTITKYTDKLFGEFLQSSGGSIPEEQPAEVFEEDIGEVPGVPTRFDWSDDGVVPEVRDQKDCGSCYAFTTTDLTATQWAIDHGEHKSYTLAPQVVLDCIKAKAAFGCNGGRPYLVLSTHANCSTCPWPKESCYPYENKANDKCKTAQLPCVETDQPQVHVKHAYYLDLSNKGGEQARVAALIQGGPVAALVEITDEWQFYSGGVMRASQCNASATPNHAVLITGYDYTGSVPAYIIKNSWGKDWGEEGYFRLEAGKNACGVGKFLTFACTEGCGDAKSHRHLIDRAILRQKGRGFGTTPIPTTPVPTTPAPQGYGVPAPFPSYPEPTPQPPPYGEFTFLPIAPPPPRPPTEPPAAPSPAPTPPAASSNAPPAASNPPPAPPQTAVPPQPSQPSPPPPSASSPEPQPPAFSPPPSYASNNSPSPGPSPAAVPAVPGFVSPPGAQSASAQPTGGQQPPSATPVYQKPTPPVSAQPAAPLPNALPSPASSLQPASQPIPPAPSSPTSAAQPGQQPQPPTATPGSAPPSVPSPGGASPPAPPQAPAPAPGPVPAAVASVAPSNYQAAGLLKRRKA